MPGRAGSAAPGRSSSTEAASRGVAGVFLPLSTSRACSARAAGRRRSALSGRPGPAGSALAGPVLAGPVLAGSVLAGSVLAGSVLAGSVLAGSVLAGSVTRPLSHLGDQLDLDRSVQWENGHPDRAAGVAARLTEHLQEQLACAVDDLRLMGEVRGG